MKKNSIAFLLVPVILLIMAYPVSASPVQATITPTRNILTPPSTPVPGGSIIPADVSFDCPAGVPEGYGEVVPDPGWVAACGHCLPGPTEYPTYGPDPERSIDCAGGSMTCTPAGPDAVYFMGSQGMDSIATGDFQLLGEMGTFQDIYLYYRYAGYDVVGLNDGEIAVGRQVLHRVRGEQEYTVGLPVNNLPAMYEYQYQVQDGVLYTLDNSIHFVEGESPIVQNFGCTRIYVSTVPFSSWENFTCPLVSTGGGGGTCEDTPQGSPSLEVVEADHYVLGFGSYLGGTGLLPDVGLRSADIFSNWTFNLQPENGTGYVPDTHLMVVVKNPESYPVNVYINYRLEYSRPADQMILHPSVLASGVSEYSGGGMLLSLDPGQQSGPIILKILTPDCLGCSGTARLYMHLSSYPSDYYEPCTDIIEDNVGQPITGNVCDVVIPYDPEIIPDFDLFIEQPSICTTVPAVDFYTAISGGVFGPLLENLAPAFMQFLDDYGILPASTICYHTFDFKTFYILNIPMNLSALAGIVMAVWVLRKLTSKGA